MAYIEGITEFDLDKLARSLVSRKPDNLIHNVAGLYVSMDYVRRVVREELNKLLDERSLMDEEKR